MITYNILHEMLDYDLLTGIFRWKVRSANCVQIGDIAGYKNSLGYIIITVNEQSYKAHRLAWFYEHGYLPENDIDHEDRIRHHNWISNLREASKSCNQLNTGNRKNNTSGVKGVVKFRDKWLVRLTINKRNTHLGYYKDFDEAVCARLVGEQGVDWAGCDSNSPAYQ